QSLQFELTHHWANGLWAQASYQYRYERSDVGRDIWSLDEAGPGGTYGYNRAYDRGRSGLFPTSDVVVNWVYELPVGTGKKFWGGLSNRGIAGKLLNGVIGGWASSGTFTIVG